VTAAHCVYDRCSDIALMQLTDACQGDSGGP
nr:serine proteinase (EC 3.4.21.-) 3 - nematode (Anisakis simplex) (fragments) [Anisakis simplex]